LKAPRRHWAGRPASTPLSSPWALVVHNNELFIAMAGYHQIWRLALDGSEIGPFAGSGLEDVVDGPRLTGAPFEGGSSFAQPSGLAVLKGKLYVADTNNHLLRTVDLATEKVSTLAISGLAAPGASPAERAPVKPDFAGAHHENVPPARVQAAAGVVKLHVSLK